VHLTDRPTQELDHRTQIFFLKKTIAEVKYESTISKANIDSQIHTFSDKSANLLKEDDE